MQEVKKIDKLVNEICHKANVECYRATIKTILESIYGHGAVVSCTEHSSASSIYKNHIRLSTVEIKVPVNIIWSLLHEFGHYLDGPRQPEHIQLDREINAWKIAETWVDKYPQLILKKSSFKEFRAWCMNSYYNDYNIPIDQREWD